MSERTLFYLQADDTGLYDGSLRGKALQVSPKVRTVKGSGAVRFADGAHIEVPADDRFGALEEFSIRAQVRLGNTDTRQNIVEGQDPPIALYVEKDGTAVGAVHVGRGWQKVTSESAKVPANTKVTIHFTRDKAGQMRLEVDGSEVAARKVQGALSTVGDVGLVVGAAPDKRRFQLQGQLFDLVIESGAVAAGVRAERVRKAEALQARLKERLNLDRIRIEPEPGPSYARLQPVKSIMSSLGVEKLDDLTTMAVPQHTVIEPGTVLIAPPKSAGPVVTVDWGQVATEVRAAKTAEGRTLLAKYLPNRNSADAIRKALDAGDGEVPEPARPGTDRGGVLGGGSGGVLAGGRGGVLDGGRGGVLGGVLGGGRVLGPIVEPRLRDVAPAFERTEVTPRDRVDAVLAGRHLASRTNLSALVDLKATGLKVKDAVLAERLESQEPRMWPAIGGSTMFLSSTFVLPVDASVIMAHVLDLRGVQLRIEPEVARLYLIADEVRVDAETLITWRRPGGSTAPRADNPDLNGRGYSGRLAKPNSRDGLDGHDGQAGGSGLSGAPGRSAPEIEIWTRAMNGMPNLDLNGEEGVRGGRGQRGGRGGNGADGQLGKRIWVFGWHCTTDPGDGGHGGDGGDGGRGGRGGDGGNGGHITVGVLEGTLESTVTANIFRVKNQGGPAGRGGDGGPGGLGGRGGRSGAGETCTDADDGRDGARGQPGRTGEDGPASGSDGYLDFFEFDEDAWEELFTRPWLTEVVPEYVFPGDTLTLTGSRFTPSDRVHVGSHALPPTVNADESISVTIPDTIEGGEKTVVVRRPDGTESNRLRLWVKPQLQPFDAVVAPGATVRLTGRAFLTGASVILDGAAVPTTVSSRTALTFEVPGTGGGGSTEHTVQVRVRNPDGNLSNIRTATVPRILEIPFRFPDHALNFSNFAAGSPSWSTYEDTYGAAEIYRELLPVFGHPVLTAAFYGFYHYFLKGEDNGGLATGFCTSLTAKVLDELWTGSTDTFSRINLNASTREEFTAIHGRLLSRESLIHFHDQGRQGVARVAQTYREIEQTFRNGCDRHNAPMLFFIPAGAVWDAGYIDGLGSSHCIAPIRFVYPPGHPGPSPDGMTDPDGVTLYCWDCNRSPSDDTAAAESENCRLVFKRVDGQIHFDYHNGGSGVQFSSEDGVTLGMMTNGAYLHADHDLPFSGPFGVRRFVLDFLLSPADLQVTDESGLRTGRFGSQILAEIPDSHPAYLVKGAYLLPADTALDRDITGTGSGTYDYHSIAPGGTSISLEGVTTAAGEVDRVSMNADGSQIRVVPGSGKDFSLQVAREVANEIHAVSISGVGGGPSEEVDITVAPDLSVMRIGNRGAARTVSVNAISANKTTLAHASSNRGGVSLPQDHDLVVTVTDWTDVDLDVTALRF